MMKVLALFQIYLPYFLPRTEEWSAAPYLQHFFDVEGQRVNVHPRKGHEELFPNPIDKQLSELEIKIQSDFIVPSDAPSAISMRDRCFDRIEAQVFGEIASRDECGNPEVTFAYRRSAISAINKFLYHCRVAGRDGEIGGLVWHYSFEHDRCYFPFPHTLIWFDAESKDVLRDDEGNEFWVAQSGAVRSPFRMPIELSDVNASLCGNREPSLPLALLVSAKERLMLEQSHEGIVNLASACEVASTRFIERKGLSSDTTVRQMLRQHTSFAQRRYHDITLHVVGRSFKTDDFGAFTLLENAYKTRNSVVHAGELKFHDSASSQITVATRSIINNFYRGCEAAVDWIENL
jgi:hypothetical protein